MTPILVFDLESVPDIEGLRRARAVPAELSDAGVLDWYAQQRRAQTGSDFVPPYLQKVVAIACALRDKSGFRIGSIGNPGDPEADLIRRFFELVDRFVPQLVSWNGSGFDLPVLNHRALIHGVTAAKFWEWGDDDRDFRYNSYLSRYHTRHLDLMDVLSMYQLRASAGLDAMARLCGFPGKLGMDGSEVHAYVQQGQLELVRRYCETDVMNTYLLYLRFRLLRGELAAGEYAHEVSVARERIAATDAPHWREFIAAWDANATPP
jgi:predicted PolB exonuclease-like 3'-5' exonuclease